MCKDLQDSMSLVESSNILRFDLCIWVAMEFVMKVVNCILSTDASVVPS